MNLAPPQWLLEKCEYWAGVLNLDGWRITVALTLVVDDDPELAGCAEWMAGNLWGRVTLRVDCVHDWSETWEKTLVHELLHIKHGRLDDFVRKAVFPQVAAPDEFLKEVYSGELEPFIEGVAASFIEMNKAKFEVQKEGE